MADTNAPSSSSGPGSGPSSTLASGSTTNAGPGPSSGAGPARSPTLPTSLDASDVSSHAPPPTLLPHSSDHPTVSVQRTAEALSSLSARINAFPQTKDPARAWDSVALGNQFLPAVREVRELLSTQSLSTEAHKLYNSVIPVYVRILDFLEPSFNSDSPVQKLRHLVLETLQRLLQQDAARDLTEELMRVVTDVVLKDNENNALLAVKVVIDFLRIHKTQMQPLIDPFLELFKKLYLGMRANVQQWFPAPDQPPPPAPEGSSPYIAAGEPNSQDENFPLGHRLLKSTQTFKVLQEIPIAIVLVFQSYKQAIPKWTSTYVRLVMEDCLSLEAGPQAAIHAQAKAQNTRFSGVSPTIPKTRRSLYNDLIGSQVKALSFIAYVMRGMFPAVRPYAASLPAVSTRLLRDCPPTATSARKELLVAVRHVLGTEVKSLYASLVDDMLDDNVILGVGVASFEHQRPLFISLLADLVHHARTELTPPQLIRVIEVHSTSLHDPSLQPSIHTMCVKLMLNLTDTIVSKFTNVVEAGRLLQSMFETFVDKVDNIARSREDLSLHSRYRTKTKHESDKASPTYPLLEPNLPSKTREDIEAANKTDFHNTSDGSVSTMVIERAKPVQGAVLLSDTLINLAQDQRFLLRNLMLGLKTLMMIIQNKGVRLSGEVVGKLFCAVVGCWPLVEMTRDASHVSTEAPQSKEERDLLEQLTTVLSESDPPVFQEVCEAHLPLLVDRAAQSTGLLSVPHSLLGGKNTGARFLGVLLRYIMPRLSTLASDNREEAARFLKLSKMSFIAVNMSPEENASVVHPHLRHLIMAVLKLACSAPEHKQTPYLIFLRSLFRAIGGGKFDRLYDDVAPLLQVLLESLGNLLTAADADVKASVAGARERRELAVDLSLTIPVRLSVLLPYLGSLMRPLVLALHALPGTKTSSPTSQGNMELVSQGLRTLELCLDNLTPEFLDPIMAPHAQDIMASLWLHLQPLPHNHQHSHTTLRILGKMGGRNRRVLHTDATSDGEIAHGKLKYEPDYTRKKRLPFSFVTSPMVTAPPGTDPYLTNTLPSTMPGVARTQYLEWKPLIDLALLQVHSEDEAKLRAAVRMLQSGAAVLVEHPQAERDKEGTFESILHGLFHASTASFVSSEATECLLQLAEHVFQSEAGRSRRTTQDNVPQATRGHHNQDQSTSGSLGPTGDNSNVGNTTSGSNNSVTAGEQGTNATSGTITGPVNNQTGNGAISSNPVPSGSNSSSAPGLVPSQGRLLSPLAAALLDGMVQTLAHADSPKQRAAFADLQLKMILRAKDVILKSDRLHASTSNSTSRSSSTNRENVWLMLMHTLATRYCTQCYDPLWARKTGGWSGIDMIVRRASLPFTWIREHQLEFMRALMYMLKDMPGDPPPWNAGDVAETLIHVLDVANRPNQASDQSSASTTAVEHSAAVASTPPAVNKDTHDSTSSVKTAPSESGDPNSTSDPSTSAAAPSDQAASGDKDASTHEGNPAPAAAATGPTASAASNGPAADGKSNAPQDKLTPAASASNGQTPATTGSTRAGHTWMNEEQQRILVKRQFAFMVSILVPELSSANETVRQVTQRAFRLLAECRGKPITEILVNAKDRLLNPIFSKPLRALPFGMQIGHIDAVTFCLQLDPPLPDFNEELYRVLTEALALADADDAALVGRGGYRNIVAVTNLRIASIKLLSAALACSEFMNPKQQQMRMKIISVYFKSLYSQSQAVVEVAHTALKQTLDQSQSKLPKDVLQAGLRPILMTLAEPSRLTVAGLDGLARLLELLTSYFKVEIGTKLLSHMSQIAEPSALERLSAGPLVSPQHPDDHFLKGEKPQSEPIEILAAITRIFHLLPPTAFMYMAKLTTEVVKIESHIRRSGPTPFTKPLAQFFDKFSAQAVEYLFAQIEQPGYVKAFRQSLLQPFAQQLRDKVASTRDKYLLPLIRDPNHPFKSTSALQIVHSLEEAEPGWLVRHPDVHQTCLRLFQSHTCSTRRRREVIPGPYSDRNENKLFISLFRSYLQHQSDLDTAFALADLYTYRLGFDITPLTRFLYSFAVHLPLDLQRQAINKFIDLFNNKAVSAAFKTQVLRYLINPMLVGSLRPDLTKIRPTAEISKGDVSVPSDVANRATLFDSGLLSKVGALFKGLKEGCDLWLLTELYHLAFVLLDTLPGSLTPDFRQTLWNLAWSEIKAEEPDPMLRTCALLLLSKHISFWDNTDKEIVSEVYKLLLKTPYFEARTMNRMAVNTLAPAIPARLDTTDSSDTVRVWAQWTRQIFVEDARDSQHLCLMLSLLVHNADQFYSSRRLFVPYIVNSITKLGLSATPAFEYRLLTAEMLDMLLNWQKRHSEAMQKFHEAQESHTSLGTETGGQHEAVDGPSDESRKRRKLNDGSADVPRAETPSSREPALTLGEDAYSIPAAQRDILITYLVTFISRSSETISRGEWVARNFAMLKLLLSEPAFDKFHIKLVTFQRALMSFDGQDQLVPAVTNALVTLREVVAYLAKDEGWILDHLSQMQALIDKPLAASARHPQLLALLKPIFKIIAAALPEVPASKDGAEQDVDMDSHEDKVEVKVEEGAANPAPKTETPPDAVVAFTNYVKQHLSEGLKAENNSALCTALVLLDAWHSAKPMIVETHLEELATALSKVAKVHLNPSEGTPAETVKPLIGILSLMTDRLVHLGQHRKVYISAIVTLSERSPNVELCQYFLRLARRWIIEERTDAVSDKEKAAILLKLLNLEPRRSDIFMREYLQVILAIYQDPKFQRTELTVRLEDAFLTGLRFPAADIRDRFVDIFDRTLVRPIQSRLLYLLGQQSWQPLAGHYWIFSLLDLTLRSVKTEQALVQNNDAFAAYVASVSGSALTVGSVLRPLRLLLYADKEIAHGLWVSVFSAAWASIPRMFQEDLGHKFIGLIVRDYHMQQHSARPNVIQTLLTGALACLPQPELPPHLLRYLGRTFNAWHPAGEMLQNMLLTNSFNGDSTRESIQDALAAFYSDLEEDDLFYGLWFRRSVYAESNAAISLEQNGMWQQAQLLYEQAQNKARHGLLEFTEAEYNLWEDHWVLCAEKLQQWEILSELAKHECDNDMLLECSWRSSDWFTDQTMLDQALDSLSVSATPRRKVFEAFLTLLKAQTHPDMARDFQRILDEATQLTLHKWHSLPEYVSQAHVPLLHTFQLIVEISEANTVFANLTATTSQNLNYRSNELKTLLQTWRERLPNLWDDVNVWSDLVAWRGHVFRAVNKAYVPLVTLAQPQNGGSSSTNSFAYRGYHETAWIINRFAHVLRKHHLTEQCLFQLQRIYQLPNIEIQEAFLKLREQAKCYYQQTNPSELTKGLDVINNTNFMFFAAPQKAEFFALKGMFMAKLSMADEANNAFSTAIQMDLNLARAWTEWGRFNDRTFRDKPGDLYSAVNAVSCYLQAAGLYKNAKVRKVLIRILWLLGCDDQASTVHQAFESYKGETPIWHWITFIPQLLLALSQRESKWARKLLGLIAKNYPQALFFNLRTAKDDYTQIRKVLMLQARASQVRAQQARQQQGDKAGETIEENKDDKKTIGGIPAALAGRVPWDHVEETLNILKTSFPLLALTMESMAEQIQQRFKPSTDEDMYRLLSALLGDAMGQYVGRASKKDETFQLPRSCVDNVHRFSEQISPGPLKQAFEDDFIKSKPKLRDYVQRLQRWRDKYEEHLDKRPSKQHLEHCSHFLVEFQHQKFDEVEVPGQYLNFEDSNADFVRIQRFVPSYEWIRISGACTRRITILSNKGTLHTFAVQLPAMRHGKREDRMLQLLRFLNRILEKRRETRRRGLVFSTPATIPFSAQLRLIESDHSLISLQDIYEKHCVQAGLHRDAPVMSWAEKMRALVPSIRNSVEMASVRLDLLDEVAVKMVPDNVLSKYLLRTMATPSDLWVMRKQFTLSMASSIFVTFVLFLASRQPNRISLSQSSGLVVMNDLLPQLATGNPQFRTADQVPFRLTPNLQQFIGPIGVEGLLTSALVAIGRNISEPERQFEEYLGIFVRDEVYAWMSSLHRLPLGAPMLQEAPRELVYQNVLEIVKRGRIMACQYEIEKNAQEGPLTTPVSLSVMDLINTATNPVKLALQEPMWAPWL